MKSIIRIVAVAVIRNRIMLAPPTGAQATNITGEWAFTVQTDQGGGTPTITFKQDGEKLTGKYVGQLGAADLTGTVKGNACEVHLHHRRPGPAGSRQLCGNCRERTR